VRGSEDGSAREAARQAAYQEIVPSVRSLGRNMPLRLRVCGRRVTWVVDVEGAARGGLGDGD
jgi:hypothetical protein